MKSLLGTVALAVATTLPIVASAPAPAAARAASLTLIHQDLALAPDATLTITVHPPQPIGTHSVRVAVYQPIDDRDTLHNAMLHSLSGLLDRVDLPPENVVTGSDGNVVLTVPTESTASTTGALRLTDPGVYPIDVQVLDAGGQVLSDLVTFVDRAPDPDAPPAPAISVAVLASITAPPALPNVPTPLPDDVNAALAELSRYGGDVPLSLSISPEIFSRLQPATIDQLRAVLSNSALLSQPAIPLDPSSATTDRLSTLFGDSLSSGENVVNQLGGFPPPKRGAWFAPSGVTKAGAALLRRSGVQLLVVPSKLYLAADGNFGNFTDYSQMFETLIADVEGTAPDDTDDTAPDVSCSTSTPNCIPTAAIDPVLADRLTNPALSDEQAALYTAADLVVYRDFFAESMSPGNPHALVLGLDGPGVPNPARITRAFEMSTATGAAKFITLPDFIQHSSQVLSDGRPLVLDLPQPTPVDLASRSQTLGGLLINAKIYASMLADGEQDARVVEWLRTLDTLYSTAITSDQAAAAAQSITDGFAAIKRCVQQPTARRFTLAGSSTNLPLSLTNTCAEPIKVRVRLEAAAGKMVFPPDDKVWTLNPAPEATNFSIHVVARTNGTFDVGLHVLPPIGNLEVTDPVTLNMRVNTLAGLPQVIFGVIILLVATWWLRNFRRSRRARRVALALAGTAEAPPVEPPSGETN
jgi:hypothetical protein